VPKRRIPGISRDFVEREIEQVRQKRPVRARTAGRLDGLRLGCDVQFLDLRMEERMGKYRPAQYLHTCSTSRCQRRELHCPARPPKPAGALSAFTHHRTCFSPRRRAALR
jgi:hypothetical protein